MGKEKVIVLDVRDDIKKHLRKDARYSFAKSVRDAGLDIYRCVSANIDRTAGSVFGITPDETSNKTILDICFPEYDPENPVSKSICQKKFIDSVAILKKKGVKIIKSTMYQDPAEPDKLIGKILVDLIVPKDIPLVEKPIVTNVKQ